MMHKIFSVFVSLILASSAYPQVVLVGGFHDGDALVSSSGNPGASSTDDGLDTETQYTYDVTAGDNKTARNNTSPSDPEQATTVSLSTTASSFSVSSSEWLSIQSVNQNYYISVNSEYLGYGGSEVSDVFSGSLEGYRFWQKGTSTTPATHTESGGIISDITVTGSTNLITRGNAKIWESSASNGSTFDTAEDFSGNLGQVTSPLTGSIDISGINQGKLYFFYGSYAKLNFLSLTMTGSGTAGDLNIADAAGGLGRSAGNSTIVSVIDFTNEDGYTTINYTFDSGWTSIGSSRNGNWSGIVVTSIQPPDFETWASEQSWIYGDTGTGEMDDYDGDGLSNDDERIFGLDPTDSDSSNPYVTPFDPTSGTFSYTRRTQSITGLDYDVWYSTNLLDWAKDVAATQNPVSSANGIETIAVQMHSVLLEEPRLFLRIGAQPAVFIPDLNLLRVWGSGSTITLKFNQELYQLLATDPGNYTVELDGSGTVPVINALLGEDGKTVSLTLGSSLEHQSAYNVSLNNIAGKQGEQLVGGGTAQFETWDDDPSGIKVFILAGQSNMVGYGNVEDGNSGAGTIGSLRYLAVNDDNPEYSDYDYSSLLVDDTQPATSDWVTRSDVKVWWSNGRTGNLGGPIEKGNLEPIFGGDTSTAHIGPEYAFGQIIGDYYVSDDVLIIKTAWGGRALATEFRPPSAVANRGGQVGVFYKEIFTHVHQVLDNLGTEFPEWAGRGYEIVGFAWHQGFNDRVLSSEFSEEYKDNLPDFISDVRAEFGKPDLPFVIATTGMATSGVVESAPYSGYSKVEQAQLWAAGVARPANVLSSDTRPFLRDASESPSPTGQGHHWNRNAESYFLVGKALGDDMVTLLNE